MPFKGLYDTSEALAYVSNKVVESEGQPITLGTWKTWCVRYPDVFKREPGSRTHYFSVKTLDKIVKWVLANRNENGVIVGKARNRKRKTAPSAE